MVICICSCTVLQNSIYPYLLYNAICKLKGSMHARVGDIVHGMNVLISGADYLLVCMQYNYLNCEPP